MTKWAPKLIIKENWRSGIQGPSHTDIISKIQGNPPINKDAVACVRLAVDQPNPWTKLALVAGPRSVVDQTSASLPSTFVPVICYCGFASKLELWNWRGS